MNAECRMQNAEPRLKRIAGLILAFFILHSSFLISPAYASPYYPADPDAYSGQWYLQKIEAYEAWSKARGSKEVIVAVIDTGVDVDNLDLKDNIWINPGERLDGTDNDGNIYIDDVHGWDFVDGDNDPSPNLDEREINLQAANHGTMIAGIIGAVGGNGIGGSGISPNVRIMPLRALNSAGKGNVGTVMEAIRYAVAQGADIINLSFVGTGFDTDLFSLLRETMRKGVLVVAAVGNNETVGVDLDATPLYPVCYSGQNGEDVVLGVAALDRDDAKPRFSNYGANCVDITAPGVDIYGTFLYRPARGLNQMSGLGSGSSVAAPIVSGVAALIKAINPAYQAQEIRDILLASADPVVDPDPGFRGKLGRGRINARKAIELALGGGGVPLSAGDIPHLLVAPYSRAAPEVSIRLISGIVRKQFDAYARNFQGGVRLASGDVNGDGIPEVVTGAGFGGGPHVGVFRVDGTRVSGFFAYDKKFRGGVNVAVGDLDGDGRAEIVTGVGRGGGPQVRIFRSNGSVVGSFFAYDKKFRGGVNVTVGDLDGDGRAEIITAPGPGRGSGGNAVKVFDSRGRLLRSFAGFPASFQGGVNVAVGNLDGEGTLEIIVSPQGGASPEVRVYSAVGGWQRAFLAYPDVFLGGVNLAVGDLDRDGKAEIIVGPGAGGGPHVKILDGFGQLKNQLFPLATNFRGGVSVGIIKL